MEIKMPAFQITTEYFLKEYHRFRAAMGQRDIDIEDKLELYKGLWFVYLNLKVDQDENEKEMCKMAMGALDIELNMRIGMQVRMEIEALVRAEFEAQGAENGQ
jgi:hypothetical protein